MWLPSWPLQPFLLGELTSPVTMTSDSLTSRTRVATLISHVTDHFSATFSVVRAAFHCPSTSASPRAIPPSAAEPQHRHDPTTTHYQSPPNYRHPNTRGICHRPPTLHSRNVLPRPNQTHALAPVALVFFWNASSASLAYVSLLCDRAAIDQTW